MANHKELKKFSTQTGFAELIERSPSLVRNVELGTNPISTRLVAAIAAKVGVCSEWLLWGDGAQESIPAASGGEWTPAIALNRIKGEIANNVSFVTELLASDEAHRVKLAEHIGKKVTAELLREFEKGSTTLMTGVLELFRWSDLSKD